MTETTDSLNIHGRPHIMLDIETLSTNQNATIIQLGAVSFTFENGIEHEFLVNIDPLDCLKYKRHVDPNTVEWWRNQPKEIQDSWKVSPKPLKDALKHFNDFVGSNKRQFIWAHGAAFDLGVLRSSYEAVGLERAWSYMNEMDSRTAFNMVGWRNDKNRKGSSDYHNALGDARAQAIALIELFSVELQN